MMAVIGKDDKGRIWFKSDDSLTDITEANDFYIQQRGMLWWKNWVLVADYIKRPAYYRDNAAQRGYVAAITEEKEMGRYEKKSQASFALEEVMRLRGIRQVGLLEDVQ